MTKRRALGRGLSSLISATDLPDESGPVGLVEVPVDAILPNPHQPRSTMDEAELDTLAESIQEHGIIQPLVVREDEDGRYYLIAGERRWRASKQAGLQMVPVVVKEATPAEMLELALIENIQRADLNALEEALAYRQLTDEFGLTQEEVARKVGKARSTVTNIVRLLGLPDRAKKAVVEGKISGAHARALLPLPTPEAQIAVLNSIISRELNVRQVEAIVKKMTAGERPKPKPARPRPAELVALENQFRESLGTRVSINKGSKGGTVVIHFYSDEELHTIYEAIVGEE